MASDGKTEGEPRQYLPLTCHGHSRPVPHLSFSSYERGGEYFMISACKDGNPMLRDGRNGDWIGTFIGHKGATWQAKLSPDNCTAASASADFSVKIWDAHTGEMRLVLKHDHVARAVAFPVSNSDIVATGGHEKILRIWGLNKADYQFREDVTTEENGALHIPPSLAFQVGTAHPDTIKSIVWCNEGTIVTAAGKTLRWHNVDKRDCFKEQTFDSEIKSCEMVFLAPKFAEPTDLGEGRPILCVAAGKSVYFFSTTDQPEEIKSFNLKHGVASVSLDLKGRKFVVGEEPGTWARVYDWDGREIDVMKGHHGPIWCIQFSPDGKLYATGSEDGTIRMWKNCAEEYGLWRDRSTAVSERVE
ncbi:hypothetical protein M406DRAFT_297281 [Cryphonectria parasitica EP155]|uniref:Serine-threonine kinase receptor-associated protein n=1 Tax=Cryphonectria parasitica (strain ATCC 38755 / EP155) TaxID=660469 RepID=A0A9P4XSC1_CRYP1|nr:uncharacterized protein M406DRAFT_297281 [Cryphonectria parasitica EP155]KAF3759957.1 hypothetical protein M406DRAFT_297281 [Cryphonectria parasitica EP155]